MQTYTTQQWEARMAQEESLQQMAGTIGSIPDEVLEEIRNALAPVGPGPVIMPGPINAIPDEVLEEIFKRVEDKKHLLREGPLVCKKWRAILGNRRVWTSYLLNDLPEREMREYRSLFRTVSSHTIRFNPIAIISNMCLVVVSHIPAQTICHSGSGETPGEKPHWSSMWKCQRGC